MIARGLMSSVTRNLPRHPPAVARDSFCLDCAENPGEEKLENIGKAWKIVTARLRDFRDPVEKS